MENHACENSRFRKSLFDRNQFTLTFELVPSRGGRSTEHSRALALSRDLAGDGRLCALSITENAGGHAALSPEVLGTEVRESGLDVIIHFSCKDKNRNQMESQLFAWDRLGLCDLLVITGDYPQRGFRGFPKPVFDLGAIHALDLISRMNSGIFSVGGHRDFSEPIQPTSFLNGVAVSPFKLLESELVMQYFKLHRKIAAGADYIITQVGFDVRKFHELLLYMRQNGIDIPVLGNVFVPNLTVTELMYKGVIPGCVIPDSLYHQIRAEAKDQDKGKKARLIRAARLLAVLKGMGYDGAHIGGPGLRADDIMFVLDEAERIGPAWEQYIPEFDNWPADAFYFYEKDPATGLNAPTRLERPGRGKGLVPLYSMAKMVHDLAFEPAGPLYNSCRRACLALDRGSMRMALTRFEHVVKFLAFGCQNCGDCTLAELAFLCPQDGCAKYLLNGPCGGSRGGWCEVYPGKKRCHYVRIYERLKAIGKEELMCRGFVPPRDWSLNNSSSWVNFYQGRDHTGKEKKEG